MPRMKLIDIYLTIISIKFFIVDFLIKVNNPCFLAHSSFKGPPVQFEDSLATFLKANSFHDENFFFADFFIII